MNIMTYFLRKNSKNKNNLKKKRKVNFLVTYLIVLELINQSFVSADNIITIWMNNKCDDIDKKNACNNLRIFGNKQLNSTHCYKYSSESGACIINLNYSSINLSDFSGLFQNNGNILKVDFSGFPTEKFTDINRMFSNCTSLISVEGLNLGNIVDLSNLFYNCINLQSIAINFTNVPDSSSILNMACMIIQ